MLAKIKKWVKARKERTMRIREMESDAQFEVRERNGQLWLTCNDVAVSVFDETADATTIVEWLQDARTCAKAYNQGEKVYNSNNGNSILLVDNR